MSDMTVDETRLLERVRTFQAGGTTVMNTELDDAQRFVMQALIRRGLVKAEPGVGNDVFYYAVVVRVVAPGSAARDGEA